MERGREVREGEGGRDRNTQRDRDKDEFCRRKNPIHQTVLYHLKNLINKNKTPQPGFSEHYRNKNIGPIFL